MRFLTRQPMRSLMAAVMLSITAAAGAQHYPSRDITFIVPYGPGGSTDPISRQFTSQLAKILGGNVNVENKPGGSGSIGISSVVTAKPDGYTIGLGGNSPLVYQPMVNSGLPYKTPDDYQPIVKMVNLPYILVVRADAPWKTFEEFMADTRKNPGRLRAAVSGVRATNDLTMQQLNKAAGVRVATIPFTGGGGEALVALLGGRVEAYVGTGASTVGHAKAGKVRVLAVFQKGRYGLFPEATPVTEAGYDATLAPTYYAIAPKGLPKDVQDKLVNASLQVVRSDEFLKFAKENGYVVDPKGPEGVRDELMQENKTFSDLIQFIDRK
jgi:tripartite-type tricarboxylate transporter receptor subunit TctC